MGTSKDFEREVEDRLEAIMSCCSQSTLEGMLRREGWVKIKDEWWSGRPDAPDRFSQLSFDQAVRAMVESFVTSWCERRREFAENDAVNEGDRLDRTDFLFLATWGASGFSYRHVRKLIHDACLDPESGHGQLLYLEFKRLYPTGRSGV
jgi:hypothetical protein